MGPFLSDGVRGLDATLVGARGLEIMDVLLEDVVPFVRHVLEDTVVPELVPRSHVVHVRFAFVRTDVALGQLTPFERH